MSTVNKAAVFAMETVIKHHMDCTKCVPKYLNLEPGFIFQAQVKWPF